MDGAVKMIAAAVSDLGKDYLLSVAHDEVDLATWAAEVAGDQYKPMLH